MEKNSKKATSGENLYSQLSKEERRMMQVILSPLEIMAMRHHYKPFHYKFEGKFIYFSGNACSQLAEATKHRVSFMRNRLNIETKSVNVPRRLRETFEDPRIILSLPPFARNRLCHLECYSMLRIMLLGRKYFEKRKEFGPKSMKVLDELFAKHKCAHLFR